MTNQKLSDDEVLTIIMELQAAGENMRSVNTVIDWYAKKSNVVLDVYQVFTAIIRIKKEGLVKEDMVQESPAHRTEESYSLTEKGLQTLGVNKNFMEGKPPSAGGRLH